jgi:hypothetical protein
VRALPRCSPRPSVRCVADSSVDGDRSSRPRPSAPPR